MLLHRFVRDEEQGGARRGADYRRSNAIVYAAEAARGPEAGGRLQTGFEGVEWVERGVYSGACDAACLRTSALVEGTGARGRNYQQ